MTKEEYLSILSNKIKRLPQGEYDRAMNRFKKKFDEAGEGNEQQVIDELGDPSYAGDQVILDIAINNASKEDDDLTVSVKDNVHAVWIGILAVLASPIALPITIALLCVVFALAISVAAIILALALVGIVLVLAALVLSVITAVVAKNGIATFLLCAGATLICLGLGCILTYGMYMLFVALLHRCVHICSDVAKKGEAKHE